MEQENIVMDKDELADEFDKKNINIIIQNYKPNKIEKYGPSKGDENKLHRDLEASNNFGIPNKTLEEALAFQKKCECPEKPEQRMNRFLLVHDRYLTEQGAGDKGDGLSMGGILSGKIYDYMKDYLGIQTAEGEPVPAIADENSPDYVFEVLKRNTKGIHKIVFHLAKELSPEATKEVYDYLSRTTKKYDNVRFLVLDQKDRGIKEQDNFKVMEINNT